MNITKKLIYQDFVLIDILFLTREYLLTRVFPWLSIARVRAYINIKRRCYEKVNFRRNRRIRCKG